MYQDAVEKFKAREYKLALPLLQQCLAIFWQKRGEKSVEVANTFSTMASCYRDNHQMDEAIECCKQALAIYSECKPDKLVETKTKLQTCLAKCAPDKKQLYSEAVDEYKCKRYVVAKELLQYLLTFAEQNQASEKDIAYYYSTLASCEREMNENDSGLQHAKLAYALRKELYGEVHELTKKDKEKVEVLEARKEETSRSVLFQ